MEIQKDVPFLRKEELKTQGAVFRIKEVIPEITGRFGKELPIIVEAPSELEFKISLWRQHKNKLIDAFGTNSDNWQNQQIYVKAVEVVKTDQSTALGWAIKPAEIQEEKLEN